MYNWRPYCGFDDLSDVLCTLTDYSIRGVNVATDDPDSIWLKPNGISWLTNCNHRSPFILRILPEGFYMGLCSGCASLAIHEPAETAPPTGTQQRRTTYLLCQAYLEKLPSATMPCGYTRLLSNRVLAAYMTSRLHNKSRELSPACDLLLQRSMNHIFGTVWHSGRLLPATGLNANDKFYKHRSEGDIQNDAA